MRAEIITVGSELVTGRTVDLHSAYISKECTQQGIEVFFHTSVDDHRQRLCSLLSLASSRSQLIFLCGGLGPTMDDLTKETLAEYLDVKLIQDDATLKRLHEIFSNRSFIPANNHKQTYVFPSGSVFPNDHGTAPGLAVQHHEVTYILLPGPPSELIPMFENSVRGYLKQLNNDYVIRTHTLSFFGIGESYLEGRLQDVMAAHPDFVVAPYVKDAELTVSITAKERSLSLVNEKIERVRDEIISRVGSYCFSEREETLEEILISLLRKRKLSVATAESCTGGLLSYLFTTVPGASGEFKGGWVCYTNNIKENVVGVPEDIINTYGAVSRQTAEMLACRTLDCFNSHYALSTTGVAGPTSTEGKPVGLVYIAIAEKDQVPRTYQFQFSGSRKRIQLLAAKYALFILLQRIKKGEGYEPF